MPSHNRTFSIAGARNSSDGMESSTLLAMETDRRTGNFRGFPGSGGSTDLSRGDLWRALSQELQRMSPRPDAFREAEGPSKSAPRARARKMKAHDSGKPPWALWMQQDLGARNCSACGHQALSFLVGCEFQPASTTFCGMGKV